MAATASAPVALDTQPHCAPKFDQSSHLNAPMTAEVVNPNLTLGLLGNGDASIAELPNTPMDSNKVVPLVDPDMTTLAASVYPTAAINDAMLLDTPITATGGITLNPLITTGLDTGLDPYTAFDNVTASNEPIDPEPMEAFAKLQFPDGDFFVNTFAVELGRDLNAMRHERRRVKEERRRKENEDALSASMIKPEDDSAADGPTLLDIPPLQTTMPLASPTAVSAVSEAGGIIGMNTYSSEDESMYSRTKPKWKHHSNDSSVSHSIAPATLHNNANDITFTSNLFSDGATHDIDPVSQHQECPFIPIHPQAGTVMNNISRKHLRIEYNGDKACWELHVLGRNGVWVDEVFYGLGATTKLVHGSYILVQSISIIFHLPDNARGDPELDNSPASDPDSNTFSDIEAKDQSDSAQNDSQTPSKNGPRKIKLNLSKKAQTFPTKAKVKDNKKAAEAASQDKKNTDGDKPAATTEPAKVAPANVKPTTEKPSEPVANPAPAPVKPVEPDVPAVPAADLPVGSVLAGVAPEDMPAKRKGPGRPPKNGVMSKRDEAIIKRKKKELQKAGQEIPPLADLLVMARAEAAGMTTKKDKPEDGHGDEDVRKTTEATGVPLATAVTATGVANVDAEGRAKSTTATPNRPNDDSAAKAVNKTARSPSPQKPEGSYTEEQLKKPNKTYVILIHEALEKSSSGIMDLQQIYDAIQKMYPYYKYRSQTQGWQSSIRHNLIGSEAFEEAGKIGKGRLWKINQNHPIDKEKKRKVATPEPERSTTTGQYPYTSGQYPYTNQGYPSYRPSPYGRPYGPPNALAKPAQTGQTTQTSQASQTAQASQKPGTYQSPYSPHPPPATANGARPSSAAPASAAGTSAASTAPRPNGYQPPRPPQAGAPTGATPATAANRPAAPTAQTGTAPSTATRPTPSAPPAKPAQSTTVTPAAAGQPAQPQQQADGKGWEVTIEEIMTFNKDYLAQFKGEEQKEAKALFHRAVYRYIHKDRDHGPFHNDEERKVAEKIEGIIAKNNRFRKPAPRPAMGAPAGTAPRPTGAPQSTAGAPPRPVGAPQAGVAPRPGGPQTAPAARPAGGPSATAPRPAGTAAAPAPRPPGAPQAGTVARPAGAPPVGAAPRPTGVPYAPGAPRPAGMAQAQQPRAGMPSTSANQPPRPGVPAPPTGQARPAAPGALQGQRPQVPAPDKAPAPRPGTAAPVNAQAPRPGVPMPAAGQPRPGQPVVMNGQIAQRAPVPGKPGQTPQPAGAPASSVPARPGTTGPAPGVRPANYTVPRPPIQNQAGPAPRTTPLPTGTSQGPRQGVPVSAAAQPRPPNGAPAQTPGPGIRPPLPANAGVRPGAAPMAGQQVQGQTQRPVAAPNQAAAAAAAAMAGANRPASGPTPPANKLGQTAPITAATRPAPATNPAPPVASVKAAGPAPVKPQTSAPASKGPAAVNAQVAQATSSAKATPQPAISPLAATAPSAASHSQVKRAADTDTSTGEPAAKRQKT